MNMKKRMLCAAILLNSKKISLGTNLTQHAAMPLHVFRISVTAVHVHRHLSMPKPRATGGDGLHPTVICSAYINMVKMGQCYSAVFSTAFVHSLGPKEEGWTSRACNGLPNPLLLLLLSYVHLLWASLVSFSSTSGPQKLTTVTSFLAGSNLVGLCCEYRSSLQLKWTTWMLSDAKWWD